MNLINFFNHRYIKLKLQYSPQQNIAFGFFTYILFGWLLLCLPWFQKQAASILDHLFIATSAVSTTGLTTISISDTYNVAGQMVIFSLIQLGGIGYLTFTTFIILSTTKKITHWHKKLLNAEFTLPSTIKIRVFLKSVIIYTLIVEIIGALLFFIAFLIEGQNIGAALWNGVFHSVSSFCTAGFSLFNSGFVSYVDNGFINFIISFLAIAGSLGFIVVTDLTLYLTNKSHKISFTTKIVLWGFIILLGLGFLFLYFLEPSIAQMADTKTRAYASFFQAMTAMTTVGFNTVDYSVLGLPILIVTIFLMYVGASPSGTAGGIKITTLTAVWAILKSRLKGNKKITFFNRIIPFPRLYMATSSFAFYTLLIFFGTFLLSISESFEFEKIIFEVASALGTVGLSTGITSDLSNLGKMIIILLMFIGRLGVITFGLAIWSRSVKKDSENVMIEGDIAV